MSGVPWDIPATLRIANEETSKLTFRGAVEAYRDLPKAERTDAEIFFFLENELGRLHGDVIDKYVHMLD